MNKRISVSSGMNLLRRLRRVISDTGGASAIEFIVSIPVILLISSGIIEFTLLIFDYHRATEATRRGARLASYTDAIGKLDGLVGGGTVKCFATGADMGVTCSGGPLFVGESFNAIIADMQDIMPSIGRQNVTVTYEASGIGDITTPGGLKPHVTVELIGLKHDFLLFKAFTGVPVDHEMPPFSTSVLGLGYRS